MNMLMQSQWNEFRKTINNLIEKTPYFLGKNILGILNDWYKKYPDIFNYPSFIELKKYLLLDINNFPYKYSILDKFDINYFIDSINRLEAKDRNIIAYHLNTILENIMVYQVEDIRQNIEVNFDITIYDSGNIGFYKSILNGKMVLKFIEFNVIKDLNGIQLNSNEIALLTTNELINLGIIEFGENKVKDIVKP